MGSQCKASNMGNPSHSQETLISYIERLGLHDKARANILYRELSAALRKAIEAGVLRNGDVLAASRHP